MEPHEGGPALIFRHDPRAMRLDHYVAQFGPELAPRARVGLIRQLGDAMAYAHGRRLYHRALSARSVLVVPGRPHRGEGEDAAWLRPVVQISDWQVAAREADSAGRFSGIGAHALADAMITSHLDAHVDRTAEPYLAPELHTPGADPIALDVFGLGALTYLLLSGEPPEAAPGPSCCAGSPTRTVCGRPHPETPCRGSWMSWSKRPRWPCRPAVCPQSPSSWTCSPRSRKSSTPRRRRSNLEPFVRTWTHSRPGPATSLPTGASSSPWAPAPPHEPSSRRTFAPAYTKFSRSPFPTRRPAGSFRKPAYCVASRRIPASSGWLGKIRSRSHHGR